LTAGRGGGGALAVRRWTGPGARDVSRAMSIVPRTPRYDTGRDIAHVRELLA
jgi:hypothetical protein